MISSTNENPINETNEIIDENIEINNIKEKLKKLKKDKKVKKDKKETNIITESNDISDENKEINDLKEQLKKLRKEKINKIKIEKKDEIKLKKCKLCGIEKELDKFALDRVIDNKTIRLKIKCLDCYKVISSKYYNDKKEKILKKIHDVSENKKKKYQVNIIFNDIKDLEKNLELIKSKFINNDSLDELLIKRKEYKPRGKKPNNGGNNSPPVMISN